MAVTEYNATTSCVVLLSCYYIIIMLDGHGHAIIMQICGCQCTVHDIYVLYTEIQMTFRIHKTQFINRYWVYIDIL